MSRDIEDYTKNYTEHVFEEILVKCRKKQTLKAINAFTPKRIIEIGCGMDPFFTESFSSEAYCVVEPSTKFIQHAKRVAANGNITFIHDFFENKTHALKNFSADFIIPSLKTFSDANIMLQQHTVFDRESLAVLIKEAGFTIINQGSYFINPFTHQQMHQMLEHKIIDHNIINGLDKMIQYMPDLGAKIFFNIKPVIVTR